MLSGGSQLSWNDAWKLLRVLRRRIEGTLAENFQKRRMMRELGMMMMVTMVSERALETALVA